MAGEFVFIPESRDALTFRHTGAEEYSRYDAGLVYAFDIPVRGRELTTHGFAREVANEEEAVALTRRLGKSWIIRRFGDESQSCVDVFRKPFASEVSALLSLLADPAIMATVKAVANTGRLPTLIELSRLITPPVVTAAAK